MEVSLYQKGGWSCNFHKYIQKPSTDDDRQMNLIGLEMALQQ